MAVAVFNYSQWAAMFPELAGSVNSTLAGSFFTVAELLLDNTDCSPVQDATARLTMLNYAVAHLASLSGYPLPAGQSTPAPASVGRVSSASEGSVSISTDYGAVRESQAWWVQTQYGATFWQLTRALRTMHYIAAPKRNFGPAFGLRRW